MSELYEPECISLNYKGLFAKSKELTFTVNMARQAPVESATCKQFDSRVWLRFRTGHITASKMHSILHTNSDMPSVSLIKSICYPESYRFNTRKVSLGCLPGYERKAAFKFSCGRLWILYFDRLPIYWCIT